MEWLPQNWFWVLIAVVFVGMHLLGHGSHGGHGGDHGAGGHGGHGGGKSEGRDAPHQPLDRAKEQRQSQDHKH